MIAISDSPVNSVDFQRPSSQSYIISIVQYESALPRPNRFSVYCCLFRGHDSTRPANREFDQVPKNRSEKKLWCNGTFRFCFALLGCYQKGFQIYALLTINYYCSFLLFASCWPRLLHCRYWFFTQRALPQQNLSKKTIGILIKCITLKRTYWNLQYVKYQIFRI